MSTTNPDYLIVFEITASDLVDEYPSGGASLITDTSSGISKPKLLRWAREASGLFADRLLQRGFTPELLKDERPSLWQACREGIIARAMARALLKSQRPDESREYRLMADGVLKGIGEHETEYTMDLPMIAR